MTAGIVVVALFAAGTGFNWLPARPTRTWSALAGICFIGAVLVCIAAGAAAATSSLVAGAVWFGFALALYVYFRADLGLDRSSR